MRGSVAGKTPRERMDPEIAAALAAAPMAGASASALRDFPQARAALRAAVARMSAATPDDPSVSVRVVEVPRDGGPDVPVRLFRPDGPEGALLAGPLPALLWCHGGGQVRGFAAQEDADLKRLALTVGCVVASVDYRLAPEAPSPAAAEDCLLAYLWLCREARALGVDAARIGIAGASGGGCLAAAAALMIRDRGAPAPLFQSLTSPMLDDRNETPSSHEITDLGVWDREMNQVAWAAALGDRAGQPGVSPYSAPARAESLAGLPPTFLATGELDLFRDENLAYAVRLVAAGVPTELHLYLGAVHAWNILAPASSLALSFQQAWTGFLCRQFGT